MITLVLSSVLFRVYCRKDSRGLETASLFIGIAGFVGMFLAFWGAIEIVADGSSGPPADSGAFLLLFAAAVGVGAVLVWAFVLSRNSVPPRHGFAPPAEAVAEMPIGVAVIAELVVAVLAVLGAIGVLRLTVVETVAWAYVGVGLGLVAGLVLAGIVWMLIAIANP